MAWLLMNTLTAEPPTCGTLELLDPKHYCMYALRITAIQNQETCHGLLPSETHRANVVAQHSGPTNSAILSAVAAHHHITESQHLRLKCFPLAKCKWCRGSNLLQAISENSWLISTWPVFMFQILHRTTEHTTKQKRNVKQGGRQPYTLQIASR